MSIAFDHVAFLLGCLGAFAHEALRWIGLRTEDKLPDYFGKLHYWLLTALLVFLGGGLASVLSPTSVSQAIAFGIAAPAILSRLGALTPSPEMLGTENHDVELRDGSAGRVVSSERLLRDFFRG